MTRRASLVPIPAPLARALASFRRAEPSPALQAQLRATLERVARSTDPQRNKRRLFLVGSIALALLMDLPPLVAAA